MHNDVAPCCVRCTFGNLWQRRQNVPFPATPFHRLTFIFLSGPQIRSENDLGDESLQT